MQDVKIIPLNKTIQISEQDSLRDGLLKQGIAVKSTCGGCASCGQCVIVVTEGSDNLSEINFEEKQLLGNVFHITNERLSCQTWITGPVTIDISIHTPDIKKKNVIRKSKEQQQEEAKLSEETAGEKKVREGGFKKPRAFRFDTDKEGE